MRIKGEERGREVESQRVKESGRLEGLRVRASKGQRVKEFERQKG